MFWAGEARGGDRRDADDRLPELPGRGSGAGASAQSCLLVRTWRLSSSRTDPAHCEPPASRAWVSPASRWWTARRLRKVVRCDMRPAGGTSAQQAPEAALSGDLPLRAQASLSQLAPSGHGRGLRCPAR